MTYTEALEIMGLKKGYTEDEKKKAYRRLVKAYHPDLNPTAEAEVMMRKVNEANDFLDNNTADMYEKPTMTHRSIFDIVIV